MGDVRQCPTIVIVGLSRGGDGDDERPFDGSVALKVDFEFLV